MSLSIDSFKAKLLSGGARSNLFSVELNIPGSGSNELASFMCKAAQLPSSVITPIEVPFRGRKLQVPGDREFEPWNITILNDGAMEVRNAFEAWSNSINDNVTNISAAGEFTAAVMTVHQLDRQGGIIASYKFIDCWPANIAAVELANDAEGISEFTVEMQYTYWEKVK
mgnify:CR=1 FL=1|jgi:hypothetical protein